MKNNICRFCKAEYHYCSTCESSSALDAGFCTTQCAEKDMCEHGFHANLTLIPSDGLVGYSCNNCGKDLWHDDIKVDGINFACDKIMDIINSGGILPGVSSTKKLEECKNAVADLIKKVNEKK